MARVGVDQRCSSIAVCTCRRPRGPSPQYDRPSRALAWPCRRSLRAAHSDHSSLPPAARIRWPFVYNVQLDRLCFLVAPVEPQMKIPGRTGPGLSRIMQFGSGQGCREGRNGTASDGRTTKGVIEDKLSPETLAKTLLLQLHRNGQPTGDQWARALRPMPPTCPKMLILSPAIDLLAPSIEHSNAVGAALFPGVQHRLSSGLHPLRSNGVVL